jgi:hypothetical protein
MPCWTTSRRCACRTVLNRAAAVRAVATMTAWRALAAWVTATSGPARGSPTARATRLTSPRPRSAGTGAKALFIRVRSCLQILGRRQSREGMCACGTTRHWTTCRRFASTACSASMLAATRAMVISANLLLECGHLPVRQMSCSAIGTAGAEWSSITLTRLRYRGTLTIRATAIRRSGRKATIM